MSYWRTNYGIHHVRKQLRLFGLLFTLAVTQVFAAQAPEPVEARLRVYPLEVRLNGAPVGIWPIVERNGVLFAPPEAFEAWRVQRQPDAQPIEYKGLSYFSLSSIKGAELKLDALQNTLALNVRAESFIGTRLTRELGSTLTRDQVVPSLFLNYDLNYSYGYARNVPASQSLGMLGELGYSTSWGVLTNSLAVRDLIGNAESRPKLVRLETTLRHDFPDHGYTLNLGDATTRTAYLGRPAFFGGLQFSTNFGLAPDVNRQPLPIVVGQTLAPSTVQLYVNDVLRQTSKVPAGPFTLDTLSPMAGNGQVSVVVRDILGRETVITQPFFVAADMLAPGLNDWSLEAGKLRLDLGNSNFSYGDTFASGMWRRGVTNSLTVEGRAEVSGHRTAVGIAAVGALKNGFLARAGAMAAHDQIGGGGQHWATGLEWQGQTNNVLLNAEGSSKAFRYLGETADSLSTRLQLTAQAGIFLGKFGRLATSLAIQYPYNTERVITASLSYSTVVKENWQLSTTFSQAFGAARGSTFGVLVNIPISKGNSSTVSAQSRQGHVDAYTSISHVPEGTYGSAWRLLGGYQDQSRAEASLNNFGQYGTTSAELSATAKDVNVRLGATGSFLYTTGKFFVMPRHDMSAALVEVPGHPGVGVGLGGQLTTHTDADGYALVPRLNAYQSNPIRLDPNDLPITAEIDSIELPAVPDWRSVSHVTFPVRGGRAAVIRVVLDDGEPAPAGAKVRIDGEERDFYVGRRGEAYVTGLKQFNRLKLRWKQASCALEFSLPPGTVDEIARLGPIACKGLQR